MPSRYHPLDDQVWDDAKLEGLSFEGHAFFVFLFGNRRQRPSGIYRATDEQLAADTRVPIRRVQDYLRSLQDRGRIVRDGSWLFIKNYLKRQPNHERLLTVAKSQVRECSSEKIVQAFVQQYPNLESLLEGTEGALQARLYDQLMESMIFCGIQLTEIRREVRIGSGYADFILIPKDFPPLILEIKRTRADRGAFHQVVQYCHIYQRESVPVLLATGIGPNIDRRAFSAKNVCLITYDENGCCSIVFCNSIISDICGFTVPVKSQRNRSEIADEPQRNNIASPVSDSDPVSDPDTEHKKGTSPDALVTLWNTATERSRGNGLPGLVPCRVLTESRAAKVKVRLQEEPDLDWWSQAISKLALSRFSRGAPAKDGRCWRASFDWLIANDTNATKAYEGKYDDTKAV